MPNPIRAIVLKPERAELEVIENFDQSLESIQEIVGGYVQTLVLRSKDGREVTIWFNEEGKLMGLPINFPIVQEGKVIELIVGNVLVTSINDSGETVGLNDEELDFVKESFKILSPLSPIRALKVLVSE